MEWCGLSGQTTEGEYTGIMGTKIEQVARGPLLNSGSTAKVLREANRVYFKRNFRQFS